MDGGRRVKSVRALPGGNISSSLLSLLSRIPCTLEYFGLAASTSMLASFESYLKASGWIFVQPAGTFTRSNTLQFLNASFSMDVTLAGILRRLIPLLEKAPSPKEIIVLLSAKFTVPIAGVLPKALSPIVVTEAGKSKDFKFSKSANALDSIVLSLQLP